MLLSVPMAVETNLYKAIHLLAKAVNGQLAETLALEGGMPSVLWAGKKKITQSKTSVRLILGIQIDHYNYEIVCGLPKPSPSMFSLDPEVKAEYVWCGEHRRPCNTLIER